MTSTLHEAVERALAAERNQKRLADKNVEIQRWADTKIQELEARAQKAERELLVANETLGSDEDSESWISLRRRAQKAEAVVEAARRVAPRLPRYSNEQPSLSLAWDVKALRAALAALDEQNTRLGGIEGKHYAVGGRDAPPPVDEQERA